jgi:hypothetical protein
MADGLTDHVLGSYLGAEEWNKLTAANDEALRQQASA